MFGIIGTIIYGIAYSIGWTRDEDLEQENKRKSAKYNLPYYYDKKGRQRWTSTGRKRTAQEIFNEMENDRITQEKRFKKIMAQKLLDKTRESYSHNPKKDRLSFEEYVAADYYLRSVADEYEDIKVIIDSVPEERVKEIQSNRTRYY